MLFSAAEEVGQISIACKLAKDGIYYALWKSSVEHGRILDHKAGLCRKFDCTR